MYACIHVFWWGVKKRKFFADIVPQNESGLILSILRRIVAGLDIDVKDSNSFSEIKKLIY